MIRRLVIMALVGPALAYVYAELGPKLDELVNASGAPADKKARIVRAVDGDTLEVELASGARRTVRLIGIDTPETVRPGVGVECGGHRASRLLSRFEGSRIKLIGDGSQDGVDRYGRLLRYVETRRGVDVGEAQLRAGAAEVYVYDGREFDRLERYEEASGQARDRGRGAWGTCGGDFHTAFAGGFAFSFANYFANPLSGTTSAALIPRLASSAMPVLVPSEAPSTASNIS